jgi:hypothetical protein
MNVRPEKEAQPLDLNKNGEMDATVPTEVNLDDDETCCPVWGIDQVHKPSPELAQSEDFDDDDD